MKITFSIIFNFVTCLTKTKLFKGEYRIIYVTPEYVATATSTIREIVSKLPIACFAIDEVRVNE